MWASISEVSTYNITVVVLSRFAKKNKECAKTKLRLEYRVLLFTEKENIQIEKDLQFLKVCIKKGMSVEQILNNRTEDSKNNRWEHACERMDAFLNERSD